MFKWIFYYWNNNFDTPSVISKYNLWFYINLRILKIKMSNSIVFFIANINNLKFKVLKIFYKDLNYEYFYIIFFQFFFILQFFFFFLI